MTPLGPGFAAAFDLAPGMTLGPGFAAAFDLAPGRTLGPGFAAALDFAPMILGCRAFAGND